MGSTTRGPCHMYAKIKLPPKQISGTQVNLLPSIPPQDTNVFVLLNSFPLTKQRSPTNFAHPDFQVNPQLNATIPATNYICRRRRNNAFNPIARPLSFLPGSQNSCGLLDYHRFGITLL